ncbi:augurin-B-like [Sinocyclocheilus rhinocerous]|uniref:augurin-B-like n=1 Tax=Sinocyclocheilus rhinocerous TaxID=307959 RepID=UPI0007BA937D|nr:PREDICTED: augurin-B-like [Sinocyclocheilus rhinocerous]
MRVIPLGTNLSLHSLCVQAILLISILSLCSPSGMSVKDFSTIRLETDLSYWMDQARSNDQGRQHHHDENAPMSQQDPSSYRHGANVNYDYY